MKTQPLLDLKICVIFLTRLPVPHDRAIERGELARALWGAPLVGAFVGAVGGAFYALAHAIHVPPLAAASIAIAATMAATGCLHEDGLADVADGFGGGSTRDRKLSIMRDSRIGTYGVCAVFLSMLMRIAALASLGSPVAVSIALVCAGAVARAGLPAFMMMVPPARTDGMSAHAGTPPAASVIVAGLLGAAALFGVFGLAIGMAALFALAGGFVFLAWLCQRQIGGQTGDVLGTLEQIGEVTILLAAAAAMSLGQFGAANMYP
jgi:adenosylcobinamide-GDP ribazoletransferase